MLTNPTRDQLELLYEWQSTMTDTEKSAFYRESVDMRHVYDSLKAGLVDQSEANETLKRKDKFEKAADRKQQAMRDKGATSSSSSTSSSCSSLPPFAAVTATTAPAADETRWGDEETKEVPEGWAAASAVAGEGKDGERLPGAAFDDAILAMTANSGGGESFKSPLDGTLGTFKSFNKGSTDKNKKTAKSSARGWGAHRGFGQGQAPPPVPTALPPPHSIAPPPAPPTMPSFERTATTLFLAAVTEDHHLHPAVVSETHGVYWLVRIVRETVSQPASLSWVLFSVSLFALLA